MAIVAEISPQTVSIASGPDMSAVYVILVILKVPDCDKKNIALLSKLIDQHMMFALQYEDTVRLAIYRANRVLISESKPIDEWKLTLKGFDLGVIWENIIAEVIGIDLSDGKDLDESIVAKERREILTNQIVAMENKAMNERQPRRKWEFAKEINKLKYELEEM